MQMHEDAEGQQYTESAEKTHITFAFIDDFDFEGLRAFPALLLYSNFHYFIYRPKAIFPDLWMEHHK